VVAVLVVLCTLRLRVYRLHNKRLLWVMAVRVERVGTIFQELVHLVRIRLLRDLLRLLEVVEVLVMVPVHQMVQKQVVRVVVVLKPVLQVLLEQLDLRAKGIMGVTHTMGLIMLVEVVVLVQ
jgi:hypothetical protein